MSGSDPIPVLRLNEIGSNLTELAGAKRQLDQVIAGRKPPTAVVQFRTRLESLLDAIVDKPLVGDSDAIQRVNSELDQLRTQTDDLASSLRESRHGSKLLSVFFFSKDAGSPAVRDALKRCNATVDSCNPHLEALAESTRDTCYTRMHKDAKTAGSLVALFSTAVSINRFLTSVSPEMYRMGLASSIQDLSRALVLSGRHDAALPVLQEAIAVHRLLIKEVPVLVNFAVALADCLSLLSTVHRATKGDNLAITTAREAVALRRQQCRLMQTVPGYRIYLTDALRTLSLALQSSIRSSIEGYTEAVTVVQEEIQLLEQAYESLAKSPGIAAKLADAYRRQAACLEFSPHREPASPAAQRAVEIYRELLVALPGRDVEQLYPLRVHPDTDLVYVEARLAATLDHLATLLPRSFVTEALAASDEAVKILRRLTPGYEQDFLEILARTMSNLAYITAQQQTVSAVKEAIELMKESISLRKLLTCLTPQAPDMLGSMLLTLGVYYRVLGNGPAEAEVTKEAEALSISPQTIAIIKKSVPMILIKLEEI